MSRGVMNTVRRCSPEVRERAVRMVLEQQKEHSSQWATIQSIVSKIGCMHETLRRWARQLERDHGIRAGMTSDDRERLKQLERENRELKHANEILRKASAYFAQGRANAGALVGYYATNEKAYPHDSIRLTFVSNHDKNSWDGTQFEQFGDALESAIVLSVIGEGMPLIYSGQEAGNKKRLAFFEKDFIQWQPHPIVDLYQQLLARKKDHSALWNGRWGARMVHVPNTAPEEVFSFVRAGESDKVFAVFNFSDETRSVSFEETLYKGDYQDFTSGKLVSPDETFELQLEPWAYRVFVQQASANDQPPKGQ